MSYPIWRLLQPRYTIGVVGVLFNTEGKVLLVEHVFHPKHPWGLPGGWVDRQETPIEAVKREFWEELSLHVTVGNLLCQETTQSNHLDMAFICHADILMLDLNYELLSYNWFDVQHLPKIYPFHSKAIDIGRYLQQDYVL